MSRKADLERVSRSLASPTGIPPYGELPLAHALLLHEVHEGIYLPLATFAGSLHPRNNYRSEMHWIAGVHAHVFLPFLDNLPKNTLEKEKRYRVKTYYGAMKPATRKSIDKNRLRAEFRCLRRQTARHKPILPAPEEMPLSGPVGEREIALRAAEEQILAAGLAPAYSHFVSARARFEGENSPIVRLSKFAKDYSQLHDLVAAFQRKALTLRINRQRRVHHALVRPATVGGRGKTEWIRIAMNAFQGPGGKRSKAMSRREAATLAALTLKPNLVNDTSYEARMELEQLTEAARDLDYGPRRRKSRRSSSR